MMLTMFFIVFLLIHSILAVSARANVIIVEAKVSSPRTLKPKEGQGFCPTSFSTIGFSIKCDMVSKTGVTFFVNGNEVKAERWPPYAINGNKGPMFYPWTTFAAGENRIECRSSEASSVVTIIIGCDNPSATITPAPSSPPPKTMENSSTPQEEKPKAMTKTSPTKMTPPSEEIKSASDTTMKSTNMQAIPKPSSPMQSKLTMPKFQVMFSRLMPNYPLKVFEAGGAVVESGGKKYLTVFGGYHGFPNITGKVFRTQLTGQGVKWEPVPDLPATAMTHMAQAVDGARLCFVGGFVGRWPGFSGRRAFCYNSESMKYTSLPDLPEDRAGGGLAFVLVGGKKQLVYSAGVDRPTDSFKVHIDYATTWTLFLDDPSAKWAAAPDMPSARNHMAAVNSCGRVLFLGGQVLVNEHSGNSIVVSEYIPSKRQWAAKSPAQLPLPLGHISASVMAYKCGILVVGGMTNGRKLVNKVLYWHPSTDKWIEVGKYPAMVATPACGLIDDQVLCATGGEGSVKNHVYLGKIMPQA